VEALKRYPTAQRQLCIQRLATTHRIGFPDAMPADYAVMSWDTMRSLETRGARFGAHTLTHPILSQCGDEQSQLEIMHSVARIGEELRYPSPVFCYPNGTTSDFGVREMDVLRALPAVTAALSTVPARVVAPQAGTSTDEWRWQIPRFAFDGRAGAMARLLFL
jgi:peptidoglycan/xylan/chitin deacetylase (PgdA/CDA1 family)